MMAIAKTENISTQELKTDSDMSASVSQDEDDTSESSYKIETDSEVNFSSSDTENEEEEASGTEGSSDSDTVSTRNEDMSTSSLFWHLQVDNALNRTEMKRHIRIDFYRRQQAHRMDVKFVSREITVNGIKVL